MIITTAQATENISLEIAVNSEGFILVTHVFADGGRCWDGLAYLTEAEAREAANKEWKRLRAAA